MSKVGDVVMWLVLVKCLIFVFGGGVKYVVDEVCVVFVKINVVFFVIYVGCGVVDFLDLLIYGVILVCFLSVDVIVIVDLVIVVGIEFFEVDFWWCDLGYVCDLVCVDIDLMIFGDLYCNDV